MESGGAYERRSVIKEVSKDPIRESEDCPHLSDLPYKFTLSRGSNAIALDYPYLCTYLPREPGSDQWSELVFGRGRRRV